MRKYGSMSYKRTWVWSISRAIGRLDLGKLTAEDRKGCTPTTTKYVDKHGRKRFVGNGNLKKTQHLDWIFNHCFRCDTFLNFETVNFVSRHLFYKAAFVQQPEMFLNLNVTWQLRMYTYKFAGKLVRMLHELQDERVPLPDQVLEFQYVVALSWLDVGFITVSSMLGCPQPYQTCWFYIIFSRWLKDIFHLYLRLWSGMTFANNGMKRLTWGMLWCTSVAASFWKSQTNGGVFFPLM